MNYPVLALDVAGKTACACILTENGDIFTAEANQGKQHSHSILPLLQNILKKAELTWSDLRMLALGQGPGSFTGLRIAAATLAGVNASLKLPIWGLSSLAITAMQAQSEKPLWVLEDAHAGEIFSASYDQADCLQKPVCQPSQHIQNLPCGAFVALDAPDVASLQAWHRLPLRIERAQAMALLMQSRWNKEDFSNLSAWIQPVYLQLSQAEKNLQHG